MASFDFGDHYWLFDEAFFVEAAEFGVRSIEFEDRPGSRTLITLAAALSFGFAEATTGGNRSLSSVCCAVGAESFYEQLAKVGVYSA